MGEFLPIPDDDGDEKYLIDSAPDIGMESYYFIANLGTLFFVFAFTITIPLLAFLLLRPLISKSKFIQRKHKGLSDGLHGNMMIRFIIEASLDISLCIGLQFYYSDVNGGLNFDSAF